MRIVANLRIFLILSHIDDNFVVFGQFRTGLRAEAVRRVGSIGLELSLQRGRLRNGLIGLLVGLLHHDLRTLRNA